ncbi:hypothetical protein [Cryptosporangium phraense]|uniref:MinD-like ATPase involved in chromosome partitioning or flagellar assembly n=1 Tax=Cryptosporangium phraense TaxID=2593070 RepID=A0A545AN99_9ACTN|nr:hypothetical protein [Cryptosporangium phraense]TQS42808.1 hypothetical protein FL583_22390 [Cryptosporangium phraense]
MPLIVWASAAGAPGVTTTALAVAAAWPAAATQPTGLSPAAAGTGAATAVLVEADSHGGDLAARYRVAEEPGLAGLAAAARSPRGSDEMAAMLQGYARALGGARAVTAPVGSGQTAAALGILAAGGGPLAVAGMSPVPVLVDAGRLSPVSAVVPLLAAADLIVLVARADLADLAHTRELAAHLAGLNPRRVALLRGPNPYHPVEVAAQLGIPLLGSVPDDRRAATSVAVRRSWRHGAWARAIAGVAARLAEQTGGAAGRSALRAGPPDQRPASAPLRPPLDQAGSTAGTSPANGGLPAGGAGAGADESRRGGHAPAGETAPRMTTSRWPVPEQRPAEGTAKPRRSATIPDADPAPTARLDRTAPGASTGRSS